MKVVFQTYKKVSLLLPTIKPEVVHLFAQWLQSLSQTQSSAQGQTKAGFVLNSMSRTGWSYRLNVFNSLLLGPNDDMKFN